MRAFFKRHRSAIIIVGIIVGFHIALGLTEVWHQHQVEQRAGKPPPTPW